MSGVKTKKAIRYFGSVAALAKVLGIEAPSIYSWGESVPWQRQLQIEGLTGGKLKHDRAAVPAPMREIVDRAA